MDMNYRGGIWEGGVCRVEGSEGGVWGNWEWGNSIINKIYLKKEKGKKKERHWWVSS